MQAQAVGIISLDVVKVEAARDLAFVVYSLRTPYGDNHAASDLGIGTADAMLDELYTAARAKAAVLAQAFGGLSVRPDTFKIKDYNATSRALRPLLERLRAGARALRDDSDPAALLLDLESDGVHLLRPEHDLQGKPLAIRATILASRAERHLEQSVFDAARIMAERALRIEPALATARQVLEQLAGR